VGAAERPLVRAPIAVAGTQEELWLQAACGGWLLALRARHVDRLILPEEGRLLDDDPHPAPRACLGVLLTRATLHSAWDLGLLLGLPPQPHAYVLLRLGGASLALRTGPCIGIAPLPPSGVCTLPACLARDRRGAVVAAFPASAGRFQEALAPVGLALDLERLLSEEERAHAEAACLAAAAEHTDARAGSS
jgi:hypothetical protein